MYLLYTHSLSPLFLFIHLFIYLLLAETNVILIWMLLFDYRDIDSTQVLHASLPSLTTS